MADRASPPPGVRRIGRWTLRRHGDLAWVRASGAIHTLLGAPEPDDLSERREKTRDVDVPVGEFRR